MLDLQTIDEKLKHHHGAATSRDEAALRVAATRSAAGLPADHVDDAKTIAHLATLQGHPVHLQTIRGWGRDGLVSAVGCDISGGGMSRSTVTVRWPPAVLPGAGASP